MPLKNKKRQKIRASKRLLTAIRSSDISKINGALNNGASINKPAEDGATPLSIAAQCSNLDVVNTLLAAKASIDQSLKNGATPLFLAAQEGKTDVVKALLAAKANIEQSLEDGATPLFLAAQHGKLKVVNALLAAKASINKSAKDGATPLLIAAQQGNLEVVNVLLAAKASIDRSLKNRATPLLVAAQRGKLEVVKALLAAKASINKPVENGATPLFLAAQQGKTGVVKALLVAKASIDQALKNGATPLLIAAQRGNLDVVNALLAAKANIDQSLKNSATPLFLAAQEGTTDVVKALLVAKASIDQALKNGATPLFLAAQEGTTDVVKALLVAKASIDQALKNGATPLLIAAQQGKLEVVNALLAAKASIGQSLKNGATPLLIAAQRANLDVVKALLVAKASIDQAAEKGATPHSIAKRNGHECSAASELLRLKDNEFYPLFGKDKKNTEPKPKGKRRRKKRKNKKRVQYNTAKGPHVPHGNQNKSTKQPNGAHDLSIIKLGNGQESLGPETLSRKPGGSGRKSNPSLCLDTSTVLCNKQQSSPSKRKEKKRKEDADAMATHSDKTLITSAPAHEVRQREKQHPAPAFRLDLKDPRGLKKCSEKGGVLSFDPVPSARPHEQKPKNTAPRPEVVSQETLESICEKWKARSKELESENDRLQKSHHVSETYILQLQNLLTTGTEGEPRWSSDNLLNRCKQLLSERNALETRSPEENRRLRQENDRIHQQLKVQTRLVQSAAELAEKSKELQHLKPQLEVKDQQLQNLKSEINQSRAQKSVLLDKISKTNAKLGYLQRDAGLYEGKVRDLHRQLYDAHGYIHQLSDQLDHALFISHRASSMEEGFLHQEMRSIIFAIQRQLSRGDTTNILGVLQNVMGDSLREIQCRVPDSDIGLWNDIDIHVVVNMGAKVPVRKINEALSAAGLGVVFREIAYSGVVKYQVDGLGFCTVDITIGSAPDPIFLDGFTATLKPKSLGMIDRRSVRFSRIPLHLPEIKFGRKVVTEPDFKHIIKYCLRITQKRLEIDVTDPTGVPLDRVISSLSLVLEYCFGVFNCQITFNDNTWLIFENYFKEIVRERIDGACIQGREYYKDLLSYLDTTRGKIALNDLFLKVVQQTCQTRGGLFGNSRSGPDSGLLCPLLEK